MTDTIRKIAEEIVRKLDDKRPWQTSSRDESVVFYTPLVADIIARHLQEQDSELRDCARELLRLYDWRCEVGGAITDDEARKYGREKKAAWTRLRSILEGKDKR